MQQKKIYVLNYCCLLIVGLTLTIGSLSGCVAAPPDSSENESVIFPTSNTQIAMETVVLPSETPSPSATITVMPSPTASPTFTSIPLPSKTPTVTSPPLLTLTPLPTIPPEQHGQVYTQLMSSNGGCSLPCWWGIELGVTPIEHVAQLYTSLGAFITVEDFENGSYLSALFVDPQIENSEQVYHTFRAQDGIIIESAAEVGRQPDYQIEPILQQLGQPSEIWLWTIPEPYQNLLPARFRLYYPNQGIFVGFATTGAKIGDAVSICFNEPGDAALFLWDPNIWDPDRTKSIVDRANEGGGNFTLEGHPIQEVSNWNVEKFYAALVYPNHSECLETPSNLWPQP
ncbi:MAG: hypothetical protein WAS33_13320 [Candidatus Promineifilaceae bacterium]